jgi:RNA polymerase sigma-70 factor (ECF subfamily)
VTAPPAQLSVEVLWRNMHDRLEAFVARRTASAEDAEDVVQDVFLRMHLAMERQPAIESFDAWMYSIARNAVIDGHRRRRPALDPEEHRPADEDTGVEVDELRHALAACLLPFVDQLPEPYRQAVRWADIEGVSQVEAARLAGLSVPGMKSRVQRGRAKLRELVDACCKFDIDVRGSVVGFEARHCRGCTPDR